MNHGSTLTANCVWKISSLFSTGIEYRNVRKVNESDVHLSNNRIYLMFMMNF